MLYGEYVDQVVLNDLNAGVASFWRSVLHDTTRLLDLLQDTPVTIDEWHHQRAVYMGKEDASELELGFSTFYMNRANRSGILNAGPIGGKQQLGHWKIDARFNKINLAARIELLSRYRHRIQVLSEDGLDVCKRYLAPNSGCFVYVDPPYLDKGADLYLDTLHWDDHVRLAALLRTVKGHWLLTYDHDDRVPEELYPNLRCSSFQIAHTAARQHVGYEYAVFSDQVFVPSDLEL